jgi:hypothetical protein
MKVTLLQPVRHDGKAFEVGAVVDLPKDAAQALVACGSAEEGGKARLAKPDAGADAKSKHADALAHFVGMVESAQAQLDTAPDEEAKATAEAALGAAMAALANLEG